MNRFILLLVTCCPLFACYPNCGKVESGIDAGVTSKPYRDLYSYGTGHYGTDYFIWSTPSGLHRTVTLPPITKEEKRKRRRGLVSQYGSVPSNARCLHASSKPQATPYRNRKTP